MPPYICTCINALVTYTLTGDDLIANTEFALPVFHAHGHVLEYQVCM